MIVRMEYVEISRATLLEMMYQALVRAAIDLPEDVERSLREAYDRQDDPLARLHLELTLANVEKN